MILVLITVGCGILCGNGVVMDSLLDFVRVLPRESASEDFFDQAFDFFWLSGWVCCCVVGWGFAPSVLFCQACLQVSQLEAP